MSQQNKLQLHEKELLARISELELEIKKLKDRKYGLIWEDKPEEVVLQCKANVPILREVKNRKIVSDNLTPNNLLIEGDNYHSLSVLNYTHRKSVDLVYIDPPYNTGAKNWRYNNDYVDGDDDWRHSKWVSYMNRRLLLAKNVLKDRGVLVCAIDENEHANLGLLIHQIFTNYTIDCVTVVHNPRGVQGKNFSYNHEYIYFAYPNDGGKYILDAEREETLERNFRVDGSNSPRSTSKTMFFPIIIEDKKIVGFGDVADVNYHPKQQTEYKKNGQIYVWPIDINGIERKWSFSRNSIEEIKDQLIFKNRKDRYEIYRQKDASPYRTVWINSKYDANEYGSKLVNSIIDTNFPFPKSIYNVLECVSATVGNNKTATVLDFFAGSGTTGHAVLELNKQDGGNRKFILCTNNENNICEEVTYERIKRVIKGYKNKKGEKIEGLGGNLSYYKTDLVNIEKIHKISDEEKIKVTYQAGEMIAVREDTLSEIEKNEWWQIFEGNNKITAIYFKEDKEKIKELIKKLISKVENEKTSVTLYIFGWGKNEYKNEYSSGLVRVEDIPEPILEVYKEINRL
jgi:adenine-specific DNA-methyltransferase